VNRQIISTSTKTTVPYTAISTECKILWWMSDNYNFCLIKINFI